MRDLAARLRIAGRRALRSARLQPPAFVAGPAMRSAALGLTRLDSALARSANLTVQRHPGARRVVALAAGGLAAAEIALMLLLAVSGRPRAVVRMLAAVSTVYATVELIGLVWHRQRPFASHQDQVAAVVPHDPERSFPSRHVASAVAMARVGAQARPRVGRVMAVLAGLLAVGRVGAGLHYPSDALGGAALGFVLGSVFRDWP